MSLLALKPVVEPTNSIQVEVWKNIKTSRFLPTVRIRNFQRQVLLPTKSLEFGFSLRIFALNRLALQSLSSINKDILQVQKHLFLYLYKETYKSDISISLSIDIDIYISIDIYSYIYLYLEISPNKTISLILSTDFTHLLFWHL